VEKTGAYSIKHPVKGKKSATQFVLKVKTDERRKKEGILAIPTQFFWAGTNRSRDGTRCPFAA
jgi:hypothetical protein